jgi:hypothetical protein
MRKKAFTHAAGFLLLLPAVCICIGYSQESTTDTVDASNIEASIGFYNKQIYYVNSPIIVEFQIVNHGEDPFLFIASFDKMFTFDFDVRTVSNRSVDHSRFYELQRRQFKPVMNDKITLKQNEVYGVRIDIGEWFDFQSEGDYIVKGVFYPNLITDPEYRMYSDVELFLHVNPPYTEKYREEVRIEEIQKLKAEILPPYDVVAFTIKALMDRDFEKYFLYIRMDKFIMQFQNARRKYMNARDADKPKVIEEFRQYLMGKNKLENIPFAETVPTDFEIEETHIIKRDARVVVTEYFEYGQVRETKRYTYFLHKYGDQWFLENYEVVNIR